MAWQGELVKFAMFLPVEAEAPSAFEVWKALANAEPETSQRPRAQPGIAIAAGRSGQYNLSVLTQPGRVDVTVQQFDDQQSLPTPQPMIEDVPSAITSVKAYGEALLKKHAVVRLGCALQLVKKVASGEDPLTVLNSELGETLFKKGTHDPQLQLNVRTKFEQLDLQVNRLCRWGATELQTTLVTVPIGGGNAIQTAGVETPVVFLHVDANSLPSMAPIEGANARALFAFLWDQAVKVMENGRSSLN